MELRKKIVLILLMIFSFNLIGGETVLPGFLQIDKIQGEVTLKRGKTQAPPKIGGFSSIGDFFISGVDGKMTLLFPAGLQLDVMSMTFIGIDRIMMTNEKAWTRFSLLSGTCKIDTRGQHMQSEIKTPWGIAKFQGNCVALIKTDGIRGMEVLLEKGKGEIYPLNHPEKIQILYPSEMVNLKLNKISRLNPTQDMYLQKDDVISRGMEQNLRKRNSLSFQTVLEIPWRNRIYQETWK